jgi:hypothetical protein
MNNKQMDMKWIDDFIVKNQIIGLESNRLAKDDNEELVKNTDKWDLREKIDTGLFSNRLKRARLHQKGKSKPIP